MKRRQERAGDAESTGSRRADCKKLREELDKKVKEVKKQVVEKLVLSVLSMVLRYKISRPNKSAGKIQAGITICQLNKNSFGCAFSMTLSGANADLISFK